MSISPVTSRRSGDAVSTDDIKSVSLTQRELDLLLQYCYPFDDEEEQLRAFHGKGGTHVLKVDSFYLSRLIGDLVYSARSIQSQSLLDELDALCDVLENAEEHNSRVRGLVLE
jgi:hypothetical protein